MFSWRLAAGDRAVLILAAQDGGAGGERRSAADAAGRAQAISDGERQRRAAFGTPLDRAANAYLVRRGRGRTIIAGYPWFTDWGRDTFIAVRGLCASPSRAGVKRDILLEWAGAVSDGMLPNRFPDSGEAAEFNSVDASLWYVVVVGELLDAVGSDREPIADAAARLTLERAVLEIVRDYNEGHGTTRSGRIKSSPLADCRCKSFAALGRVASSMP